MEYFVWKDTETGQYTTWQRDVVLVPPGVDRFEEAHRLSTAQTAVVRFDGDRLTIETLLSPTRDSSTRGVE